MREQGAVEQIQKSMDTTNIRNVLLDNLEHPHWDTVAERCLSCTNCTMVCPTCFCSSVSEVADLSGEHVQRIRQWDSCFNLDFSYTASGTVRNDRRSRFRQWLTHKLASWHDQFDSSGCVGCGRCITWCPVGIDLTEEVAALREPPISTVGCQLSSHHRPFATCHDPRWTPMLRSRLRRLNETCYCIRALEVSNDPWRTWGVTVKRLVDEAPNIFTIELAFNDRELPASIASS
ncbi:MAG: 4Fe-4S dicluster domain-containing protein [Pirellulaceae bacterium]